MSRDSKMFYKKHENSQSKHNSKFPIKLGIMLLPTEKIYFYKKRV